MLGVVVVLIVAVIVIVDIIIIADSVLVHIVGTYSWCVCVFENCLNNILLLNRVNCHVMYKEIQDDHVMIKMTSGVKYCAASLVDMTAASLLY